MVVQKSYRHTNKWKSWVIINGVPLHPFVISEARLVGLYILVVGLYIKNVTL